MDDLLADFVAETREMLETSGSEIVAWEADPADRARLDTIFRFVHTVKGNCGFFDFPRLEALSHAAEDALAECRSGQRVPDRALVSAVLAIIDRISAMTDAIEAGEEFAAGGDEVLIAALSAAGESDVASAAMPCEPTAEVALPSDEPVNDDEADGAQARKAPAQIQRSIRLPVDLLDEVMKGVSDMVLARNDLARRLREAGEQPTIDGPFERLSTILGDVRASITRMRMQRLEHLFGSLPRLVRDLSNELGKQVMVDFEGGEVEMDREMIEMVRDPLTHIIRNAIDHGLESPAQRREAGKREIGLLKFSARQSGNQISLTISDDGRGIATDKLVAKAISAGIVTRSEAEAMSDKRKLALIFEAGLSTADEVSAVSGRGVGMDVVRSNIERVGGSIDLVTTPGAGTAFQLKLPLTLSIIAALTVGSGDQRYAIPRSYIEEIVFGNSANVEFATAGGRRLVTFRERRVPVLSLAEILTDTPTADSELPKQTLVLVKTASNEIFALAVDRVYDHEDVVVKPIAPAVMDTRLYAGTTLLDDGKPMMLLDLPSIADACELIGQERVANDLGDEDEAQEAARKVPVMLFTGLDGKKRAVRLELVRRIDTIARDAIDIEGSRAQAVINGEIFTLAGHMAGPLDEDRCRLLRLSDGESEIVYAVREVLDAADIAPDITPSPDDQTIEGVALIDDRMVPVIDGYALFSGLARPPRAGEAMTCRLPGDSDWARTILEPLIEAAGYRVVGDDRDDADVAIQLCDAEPDTVGGARSVIRLRPDPDDDQEGTIYRYDRDGLLAALKRLRTEKRA